jgi:hypothetical protein
VSVGHLLIEIGYHRYSMNDLIRSHASALSAADPAGEREPALGRLLDYYQHTAVADARLTRPARTGVPASAVPAGYPDLADPGRALSWVRAERANLLACRARQIVASSASSRRRRKGSRPSPVAEGPLGSPASPAGSPAIGT